MVWIMALWELWVLFYFPHSIIKLHLTAPIDSCSKNTWMPQSELIKTNANSISDVSLWITYLYLICALSVWENVTNIKVKLWLFSFQKKKENENVHGCKRLHNYCCIKLPNCSYSCQRLHLDHVGKNGEDLIICHNLISESHAWDAINMRAPMFTYNRLSLSNQTEPTEPEPWMFHKMRLSVKSSFCLKKFGQAPHSFPTTCDEGQNPTTTTS